MEACRQDYLAVVREKWRAFVNKKILEFLDYSRNKNFQNRLMKVNDVSEAKITEWLETFENIVLQHRQCTYNVTLKRVRVTIVTVKK